MHRKRSVFIPAAMLVLAVALGGWSCSTGTATLRAQSVTVDTVVMAGEMFFLVAGPFDALCPQRALPLEACRGWRLFVEGKAGQLRDGKGTPVRDAVGRRTFLDPADAALCGTPSLTSIGQVLDRCGYLTAYPFVVGQYQAKKDVAVSVASTAEAIVKQLTGFGKAVNAAKEGVRG